MEVYLIKIYLFIVNIFNNVILRIDDKPGMLDYMIWPWFERMEMLPVLSQGVISIDLNKFPKLVRLFSYTSYFKHSNIDLLTILG